MPTITVSAPRSMIIWARVLRVRTAKESITSSTVTSTLTPLERNRPPRPPGARAAPPVRDEVLRAGPARRRHAGNVHHDDLGAVGPYPAQQLLGELAGPPRIPDADDGENEEPARHLGG